MKKLFTIISLSFSVVFAFAQDRAIFTHYHLNPVLINPGYTGFTEVHHLQMNLRNQWTSFPGAPQTYAINYNGPFGKKIGFGLNVLSEDIAQVSRFTAGANYAFRFKVNEFKMGLGFSAEYQSFNLASSVFDQANPLYEPGDFIIEDAVDGINYFDAGLGFFGEYQNATYFGISFPNLVRARLDVIENGEETDGGFGEFYIFHLGHKIKYEEHGLTINPSMMIRKIRDIPCQVDFNLVAGFAEEKLQAGVSYRSGVGGAIGLLLGTKLPPFSAYYSYDVSFQRFQQYSGGAHEITFGIDFKNIVKKRNITSGNN